jgi:hypothetical protein
MSVPVRPRIAYPIDRYPLGFGRVVSGADRVGVDERQEVDQHVMVADAALPVANHARDHAADVDDADVARALFRELPTDGVLRGLTELDEAAGQTPLPGRRISPAADEQHVALVQDDGADADARDLGILSFPAQTILGGDNGVPPSA